MHNLINPLVEFGLSESEAKIYVSLLELDLASASELARHSGINRSTTYVVTEALKKRGLVGVSEDKNVQRFFAAPPDTLLYETENRIQRAEDIKNKISHVLQDLKALQKDTKQKPKVKVFEGRQGIITSMEDTLTCKEKVIRICSSHENWLQSDLVFRRFMERYIKKRIKLGIKMHGIHPDSKVSRHLIKLDPSKFDKAILIPREKYKFPAEIAIYDDKIGYVSPDKKGLAILIESKEMADVMKNIFDLAWEEAKRLNVANR